MDRIDLIVHGASGRMGRALGALIGEFPSLRPIAAVSRLGLPWSADLPGTTPDDLAGCPSARVAIDFSLPSAFDAILALCVERGMALVSGTTGLDDAQRARLDAAAARIPVLWASNFSPGVAVLEQLVEQAAGLLPDWDAELCEAHHRHKRDAPSGTALTLAAAVARGRGEALNWIAHTHAEGPRFEGGIGIASLRGGDVVGDHRLSLFGSGERIELAHQATDRSVFARGALLAASRIAGKPPGRYRLLDLIRG